MPTGLFDDLVETEEPQSPKGLFDDLIDRDEGTTLSGKYYPPEERKGVTYEGRYYPSNYEMEKQSDAFWRTQTPKGIVDRFREGVGHGMGGGVASSVMALKESDDGLRDLLLAEQRRLQASDEITLPESVAETAGNLLGAGISAVLAHRFGGRAGTSAFFGAQSGGDAFMKAGLRALAEGKTPEEAVQIAKKVGLAGAAIGAAEGAIIPGGGFGSVRQGAKTVAGGGALFGGGQTARNVAERVAGLQTPIMEGVPQATAIGLGIPLALRGAGAAYRYLTRGRPAQPPPVPPRPSGTPVVEVLPPEGPAPRPAVPTGKQVEGPVIDVETITSPSKPLEPAHTKLIEDSIKKAASENPPGEAGIISGTPLEKWADDVLSSDLRGRMSVNPVDILTKDIAALAVKGASVLERGIRDYPAWSAEMTRLYGDEFKPILRKVYLQSLQVKGTTPNAVFQESVQPVSDVRQQPIQGEGQVSQAQGRQEAVGRVQQPVQPREGGQAQVPLTAEQIPQLSVQEVAKRFLEIPPSEIVKHPGGPTGFQWELGSRARTPEDVTALRQMAEAGRARFAEAMKAGDFDRASQIAALQPAEAYEYATGVKLDGTPKWETMESLTKTRGLPEYRPPVPDEKYLTAKGLKKGGETDASKAKEKKEEPTVLPVVPEAPPPTAGGAVPSRGIAASARKALREGNVPRGTSEAAFITTAPFQKAVEAVAANDPVAPPVIIDTAHIVPRLQPWGADKKISSSPAGVGRIPGVGRLFDPRSGAFSEVDQAIIANAKERGVGETVAALWAQTHKAVDPFTTDASGRITMAGGVTGHMADVIEAEMRNPGSQPLTPEQRNWVDNVWKPLHRDVGEMLTEAKVKGFDIMEGEGIEPGTPYFPRIAIGKRDVEGGTSGPGGRAVGGKQFFQKSRQYASEAEGAETTIYEPDATKRVAAFISKAYKAIADHRLAQDESLGGRALSDGPPLFQKEGQVFQPAFSGKVFPKETADRLNKFYGESAHDWVRKLANLNDAAKAWKLTLDLSAPLTQGLPVLFNRPAAWARSTWNSIRALADPNHLGQVLNRPEMREASNELAQLGVSLGRLQDFMAGAERGQLVTRVPVLGKAVEATGRSFGAFMDLAKIEMWRSFREVAPREQWPRMAELVENLAGSARMESIGINPGRALGERMLFLAPTYYRAGVSLVATALQGGVAGNAARAALARFGMGVTLASVAGMAAAGLSWEEIQDRLNPAKGKFLKIPVQVGGRKVEVGFGHLLISLSRLAGDTIEEAASDKPAGTGVEKEPWKKWLRTHSAPVPSTLIDLTTGTDVMGNEIGTARAIGSQFVPITVSQGLQSEGTATQQLFDASLSFFGLNAYPQSVQEQFRNERDKMSKDKYGKTYESLPIVQQAAIHRALKQDQRFKAPPAPARAREIAFENDVARQNRLLKALPADTQKRMQELGLHVTGYEPRIKVGETDLPLTRKQAERLEALIAEEYKLTTRTIPWTNWGNLKPERRQEKLNDLLEKAKTRAKTKFRTQRTE